LSCCRDKHCREGGCRVRGRTLRTLSFVNSGEVASGEICFWWSTLLMFLLLMFSISNWLFLIPCYCQNSIGDLRNTLVPTAISVKFAHSSFSSCVVSKESQISFVVLHLEILKNSSIPREDARMFFAFFYQITPFCGHHHPMMFEVWQQSHHSQL